MITPLMKKVNQHSLIVTGGAGFIGSNFVRFALTKFPGTIVVVDKLTYAGHRESLDDVLGARVAFIRADIGDRKKMNAVFQRYKPLAVVNFAAETHVDRSIDEPKTFIDTNLLGTYELLEATRRYWSRADKTLKKRFRFLHVSTDEVYGSLGKTGLFKESSPYAPNSPYAASKAGADHLVRAYFHTYSVPTLITNCSNNYGPYQFPEKLIPLVLLNAIDGKPLPVYGDGGNVRDWLYVEDHCAGIWRALTKGRLGEKYNIGGNNERTNIEVVKTICRVLQELFPPPMNPRLVSKKMSRYEQLITFVKDRPGHDRRYAIDGSKIRRELKWAPTHSFGAGLEKTVQWYLEHLGWCRKVQAGRTGRERLGVSI